MYKPSQISTESTETYRTTSYTKPLVVVLYVVDVVDIDVCILVWCFYTCLCSVEVKWGVISCQTGS